MLGVESVRNKGNMLLWMYVEDEPWMDEESTRLPKNACREKKTEKGEKKSKIDCRLVDV